MPKIVDHAAYREELLDGAFQLLAERGYAISMREIARALGVSTGTLYHYFPGKQELFIQLVQHLANRDMALVREALPPHATAAERLAIISDLLLEDVDGMTAGLLLWLEYARMKAPGEDSAEFHATFLAELTDTLAELLTLSAPLSRLLLAAVDGLFLHHWLSPDRDLLVAQSRLLREMVLAYAQLHPEDARP